MARPMRKKSLLIGINYTGTPNALRGCHQDVNNMAEFLSYRGYSNDPRSQVILRDDRQGPFYPTGANMLAAMDWLVSEPNTQCFMHYSGHGGQIRDPDGDRASGLDDTIIPVDFQQRGQLDSDTLHRHLVSALAPGSRLFVVLDCCHSGSAIELPYVYRSDSDGNVTLQENIRQGANLLKQGYAFIQGGFKMERLGQAKELYTGATNFFRNLQQMRDPANQGGGGEGLQQEHFMEDWKSERKLATMFSGCRDEQTSADARIGGESVGAMSWAFLQVMKRQPNPTYLGTLQQTRHLLDSSNYKQIPQLSVGVEFDLNMPLMI